MLKALAAMIALLALTPQSAAEGPAFTYIDATGTILLPTLGTRGLPEGETFTSASFSLTTDVCHTQLRMTVSWEPVSHEVTADGRSVAADTVLHAELVDDLGKVLAQGTKAGGSLYMEHIVPAEKSVRLVLTVDLGADVRTDVLIMGWVPPSGPGCPP